MGNISFVGKLDGDTLKKLNSIHPLVALAVVISASNLLAEQPGSMPSATTTESLTSAAIEKASVVIQF